VPPFLDWCAARRDWVRNLVSLLVEHESPSLDKSAVDRCGAVLADTLESIGGSVTRIPNATRGDVIRADFGGRGPGILILGHIDTVWPVGQLQRMPLVERDGRLYGPGIFDMKAGVAVAILAMSALAADDASAAPQVSMLWTTDEEIGSGTSRATIEACARECQAVLVMEPSLPGGAAKTSRKGCGEYLLKVHGVSAHAGLDPGKGTSAILEMAHQTLAISALQDLDRGITLNVGTVSGGARTNVVADYAEASIDVRVRSMADAARVDAALRNLQPRLAGARLELSGGVDRPPLERNAGVIRLYEQARHVARELGQELPEGLAGGGSDGNFTAAVGVPTLDGLGPRGDGAHALHEHVEIDDLTWRAAFLAGLLSLLGRRE
jgi:glutamate carboxypeptidase